MISSRFRSTFSATLLAACTLLALSACDREETPAAKDAPSEAVTETAPATASATTDTTVYLVRHAEKANDGENPDLTEAGSMRAAALIEALADALLDIDNSHVATTPYNRTRQTCAPAAEFKGLVLNEIEAEPEAAVSFVQQLARGSQALICGHSNTVPAILAGLGVQEPPVLEDKDYGDLFVVTLSPDGATMERRRFGD